MREGWRVGASLGVSKDHPSALLSRFSSSTAVGEKKKEEMRSESERGDEHKVANNSKSAASGAATAGRGRKLGVRL